MPVTLRWIVVVPGAAVATVVAYAVLTLIWNIVRFANIVPQDGFIDLALASFGVNAGAAAAGVLAAERLAPSHNRRVAIGVAAVLCVVAGATVALGIVFRQAMHMSLGWHLFSTAAWVGGAITAAVLATERT